MVRREEKAHSIATSAAGGHLPVMLEEAIALLNVRPNRTYVDATAGAGGHLQKLCEHAGHGASVIALDQDALALDKLHATDLQTRVKFMHSNFAEIKTALSAAGITTVDGGILADLGVSSNQLADASRGFSFLRDGPLDMRMDVSNSLTAYDLVNDSDETELANIIYQYGEERHSRSIARAIAHNRPISTTLALANIIEGASRSASRHGKSGKKKPRTKVSKIHPATRTFQALRIAVNSELDNLRRFLAEAIGLLTPGARLVVITFHSLEDRIVKQFFKQMASNCLCPPRQPICTCSQKAEVLIITPKPLIAGSQEILANIRSRSAKLRAVEKLP